MLVWAPNQRSTHGADGPRCCLSGPSCPHLPTLAAPQDGLIVVTCAIGGQAKLGAGLLASYGFTNVRCSWYTTCPVQYIQGEYTVNLY